MTDWSARARAALAQQPRGAAPIGPNTGDLVPLVVPPPTISENVEACNDAGSWSQQTTSHEVARSRDKESMAAIHCGKPTALGYLREGISGCDFLAAPLVHEADLRRPHKLTSDQLARGHAYAWDERAVGKFLTRARVFRRRGMNSQDSEDLAERLHVRDGDSDDRRLCLECSKLRESGGCTAAVRGELAGTDQRHHPVVNILYRCEAFSFREGLQ